jgi:hypothetical protein
MEERFGVKKWQSERQMWFVVPRFESLKCMWDCIHELHVEKLEEGKRWVRGN